MKPKLPILACFLASLLMLTMLSISSYSQTILYPTPAEALTRGLDPSKLYVQISFPTVCTGGQVEIELGGSGAPGEIKYVAGSFVQTSGSATMAQGDISDLTKPKFTVTTTANGQSAFFEIQRIAGCGISQSAKDFIKVTGCGTASDIAPNTNSYNILAPALTMVGPTAITNANIGATFNRDIKIIQGGTGVANRISFALTYPAGVILNSLKIGATTLTLPTPTTLPSGELKYLVTVSGPVFPTNIDGNTFFANGEEIILTENVTYNSCGGATAYATSTLAHDGTTLCNVAPDNITATGPISFANNTPLLTTTLENYNPNYCFDGAPITQTIKITNTGSGPATNVVLNLIAGVIGSYTGQVGFNVSSPWAVKNQAGGNLSTSGQVLTPTINNTLPFYAAGASCTAAPFNYSVDATLGAGVTIPAGEFITIEVLTVSNNTSCIVNCPSNVSGPGFSGELSYKNTCGTGSYKENRKALVASQLNIFVINPLGPTDILPNEEFKVNVKFSTFINSTNSANPGSTFFTIDVGPNMTTSLTSAVINGVSYPVAQVGAIIRIGPLATGSGSGGFSFDLPLTATCGTGGPKTISMYMEDQYSPCSPIVKLACSTLSPNLHCPTPCPKGGATPIKFALKRTTLGLVDADNNHKPDGSALADPLLIQDHNAVNGDNLEATWNIKVHPNVEPTDPNVNLNFKYVYVDFDLGAQTIANGYLENVGTGAATVKIYPNSNAAATPITCSVTPVMSGTIAHYELGSACRTSDWQTNDSLVIVANYTVKASNFNPTNSNTSGNSIFTTKNEVYSTYTATAAPSTAPIAATTYTCDLYNDNVRLIRIWDSPYMYSQSIKGCDNSIVYNVRQYAGAQSENSNFPYEYRSFDLATKVEVTLPPGYTVKPGSITFDGVARPDADAVQAGTTLTVTNLEKIYTKYGGTIVGGDETDSPILALKLDPSCDAAIGEFLGSVQTTYIGNGVNTPVLHGGIKNSYSAGYIVSNSQPTMTTTGSVNSYDGTGTWTVTLQNLDNEVTVPNSYIYFNSINNLNTIVVMKGANVIAPDANGLYHLGNLAPSGTNTLTVSAISTACSPTDMQVNFGYNCSGYPTVPVTCGLTEILKVNNQPSAQQLSVVLQPVAKDLCEEGTMIYSMNSSLGSGVNNPKFLVSPLTGMTLVKYEVEYPAGSGAYVVVTPTTDGAGNKVINAEDNTALPTTGLPGTLTPGQTVASRKVNLRITYNTTCEFVSGSKLAVTQQGITPCGDNVSTINGYNGIVRSNAININGATTPGGANMVITLANSTIVCTGSKTLTGTLTPTITSTQANDHIKVTIPAGLVYVANSFASADGLTASTAVAGGNTILTIVVPAGKPIDVALNYSYGIQTNSFNTACGTYDILTEAVREIPALSCNGTTCPGSSQIVLSSLEKTITVEKPEITVSTMTLNSGSIGNTANLEVVIGLTNASSTQVAPANSMKVDFYCGAAATPFATQDFTNAVPVSSTASQTFTIANSASCANGDNLTAKITPSLNSCLCTEALMTIDTPLPVTLIKFAGQAVEAGIRLNWAVANETNFSHYEVLKSTNGVNEFVGLSKVEARGMQSYNFEDLAPITGSNYYKLKMVDQDGTFKLSRLIHVNYTEGAHYMFVENPVLGNSFMINTNMSHAEIELMDVSGRTQAIQVETLGAKQYRATILQPSNGVFILRVKNNEFSEAVKLIIEQ